MGGGISTLAEDVKTLEREAGLMGLQLNKEKCEIITREMEVMNPPPL